MNSPRGVIVKALDFRIVVREFERQAHYYVHFRTITLGEDMNPPYLSIYGLNSTANVLLKRRDGFSIK